MAAILTKFNVGLIKNSPGNQEEQTINQVFNNLTTAKTDFSSINKWRKN